MREVICDQCNRSLGVIVADGVNMRTLRGFERGHDVPCEFGTQARRWYTQHWRRERLIA